MRFPIARPWDSKILGKALPYDDQASPCPSACSPGTALRLYNRLGLDYITAIGDTAYILRMDELRIYRQSGDDLEPLHVNFAAVTQPGMERPPSLPKIFTKQDLTDVQAIVEASTMPTGLYAWGGSLFVMTRIANGSTTKWTITKIDPNTNQILGTATVPTTANHLTIAPGRAQWAFIEKGPVLGWDDNQDIHSILFVPAAKFAHELKGDLCGD